MSQLPSDDCQEQRYASGFITSFFLIMYAHNKSNYHTSHEMKFLSGTKKKTGEKTI